MNTEDDDEDEEMEEARKIKRKKEIKLPTKEEYEEHMQFHIPYRSWCPFCAQGKMAANPKKKSDDKADEPEVPIIGWDYMEQREKDGKFAKGDMEPKTLVGFDRKRKWMTAEVVPHKGVNPYAVKAVSEEIENSGYSRIILKSDQEPSLLALLRTAKNERSECIEVSSEWSPVGESQSNGSIE